MNTEKMMEKLAGIDSFLFSPERLAREAMRVESTHSPVLVVVKDGNVAMEVMKYVMGDVYHNIVVVTVGELDKVDYKNRVVIIDNSIFISDEKIEEIKQKAAYKLATEEEEEE